MKKLGLLSVVLLIVAGWGCSTPVAPHVRYVTPLGDYGEGRMYVTGNRDLPRVVESLRGAGFQLVPNPQAADLVLRTSLGSTRANQLCGPVSNVRYELWQGNWVIITIAGRGPIGRCADNIVDQMTGELTRYLALSRGPETDDDHPGDDHVYDDLDDGSF